MNREVRREVKLAAFSISIADIELIFKHLDQVLPASERSYTRLSIDLPGERLLFDSIADLRAHPPSQPRVSSFGISIWGSGRSLMLFTPQVPGMTTTLVVAGESEVWCASAIEAVSSVTTKNRVWHHWLKPWVVAVLAVLFSVAAGALSARVGSNKSWSSSALFAGYIGTMLCLSALFFLRNKVLPLATLRLSDRESWIRSHIPELTLLVAALSVVLTAVGLALGRSGA